MRKLIQLLTLSLLVLTTACKKEEASPTYTEAEVSGKWEMKSFRSEDGKSHTTSSNSEIDADYEVTAKDIDWQITFNEDNSFTGLGKYTMVMSTTYSGQTSEQELDINGWGASGTWTVGNNQLTVEGNGETLVYEILSASDTKLELMQEIDETTTVAGSTNRITITYYMTFEKVQ